MLDPVLHRRSAVIAALLLCLALVSSFPVLGTPADAGPAVTTGSTVSTAAYDGPCVDADAATGVTLVVDFQDLDGNDDLPAEQIVRCSPATLDAEGRPESRTGLEAMKDADLDVAGTVRWGESFICRIEGRPTATETIPIAGNPNYTEPCIDTPPGSAYWGYWHADGLGKAWTYSNYGVTNRNVIPGGFEGWSFSLNATATSNPEPDYVPRNPALDPDGPVVSLSSDLMTPPLSLGQSTSLRWTSERVSSLLASGDWSGELAVPSGSRSVTPDHDGTFTYTITATGTNGDVITESYDLDVVGSGTPSPTTSPTTSPTGSPTPSPSGSPTGSPSNTPTTTGPTASPTTSPSTPPGTGVDPLAGEVAGWLVGELEGGAMPAPVPTSAQPTDWGLTVDALWALYAAGTGEDAARRIVAALDRNAGDYLGVKLFRDASARRAGQAAKLLVAAIVAGRDPGSFGRVMRSNGTVSGARYDLRAETEALIVRAGASRGRLSDRGLGIDNTNVFSQALAVIGLARSGGVPQYVVDYLTRQQCRAGYFRMFDRNAKTCDQDHDSPDGDGTAMGLQALMTARAHGVAGLDGAIDRGVRWLVARQFAGGSFGGGVGTEAGNTNSTGLIAQTLAEAGQLPAYQRARKYVASLTVTGRNSAGSFLAGEDGAIAYNATAFTDGRRLGIVGRDQWRRATAQAMFALAPVSFVHLGERKPKGDPQTPPGGSPPPVPDDPPNPDAGRDAPDPDEDDAGQVEIPEKVELLQAPSPTPAGRLAYLLASRLVDGDHVEVRVDDTAYVDYDLTADIGLALRTLGEQRPIADRVSRFLLDPRSQAAYVQGKGYDGANAVYAAPLAKSLMIAAGTPAPAVQKTGGGRAALLNSLGTRLAGLVDADGAVTDRGKYAEPATSVSRQSVAVIALTAAGQQAAADRGAMHLVDGACADGGFADTLGGSGGSGGRCEPADEPTGWAAQALSAGGLHTGLETEPTATGGGNQAAGGDTLTEGLSGSRVRADAVLGAARSLTSSLGETVTGDARPRTVSVLAAGRSAAGLTSPQAQSFLIGQQQPDGGLPGRAGLARTDVATSAIAAYGLTGRSLLDLPGSGLRAAVSVPLDEGYRAEAAAADPGASWSARLPWLIAGLAGLLLAFLVGRLVGRRPTPAPARNPQPSKGDTHE